VVRQTPSPHHLGHLAMAIVILLLSLVLAVYLLAAVWWPEKF
jgi:K+-transporting ATPase KdpF subunit